MWPIRACTRLHEDTPIEVVARLNAHGRMISGNAITPDGFARLRRSRTPIMTQPDGGNPLQPAEPIIPVILPEPAWIDVDNLHRHDIFWVLKSKLRRDPYLDRKPVSSRQHLIAEPQCDLGLRMQRCRHVQARRI